MIPAFARPSLLQEVNPEVLMMKDYFNKAHSFPKQLVTQNQSRMQKAFLSVPQDIWFERVVDLQDALQAYRLPDVKRRAMVAGRSAGMSERIDQILDSAFLGKYEELIGRVLYDFDGFFPYAVSKVNQNLIVFEKMSALTLVEYVVKRI